MATSNPDKLLSGVPFDFEFDAISASFAQAAPSVDPSFTGTVTADHVVAGTVNGTNTSTWDTAYGWGDHGEEGYLTSFSETDPTVPSYVKAIQASDISNWDEAYGWGDHGAEGYITGYTETDPLFTASAAFGIESSDIVNWDSAYNDKVTNMSFNDNDGILTLTQQDTQTLTVPLDGRYAIVAELDQYSSGVGIDQVGNQFSHANTSDIPSSNNEGQVFIQDIILDQFGHITGINTNVATDTNTDTKYTAGDTIAINGSNQISHGDVPDARPSNNSNNSGNTFIQDLTFDDYGHVTGYNTGNASFTNTDTRYTAGDGLVLEATEFSHKDTSSQGSVSTADNDFISGITLDTNGHITGLATRTAIDTQPIVYNSGTNLNKSGNTFNLNSTITGLSDVATSNVSIGNFDIKLDGGTNLQISYGGSKIFKIDSSGNLQVAGNVTAYAPI